MIQCLLRGAALALVLTATTGIAAAQTPPDSGDMRTEPALPGRLPTEVVPTHYDISVTPNAQALSFKGRAAIEVRVRAPTDTIVLNAADLSFRTATIDGRPARYVLDAKAETATFTAAERLSPGRHRLTIDYTGKIFQQAAGLFALDYDTAAGGKARALFTQFEASDARRFVPSWDEPGRKATFTLSVTAPAAQTVISNMPVASTRAAGRGLKTTVFRRSPKMSSYLLFLAQGDFDRTVRSRNGVEHGVVARKGPGAAQAQFALDASTEILPYFNDYFGTPYPLPKLDHLAGPGSSQFFGAMENWGAIFYFERILLSDPQLTTRAREQRNWETIAHEMAHQWFGNLVTMSWWDDLWLNEGYASWMASKAVSRFHPEWKPEVRAVNSREGAMALDARAGSHPIVQNIETVQQASQAFDAITYEKGEAVIRMVEAYLGEAAFRDGVRAYMKRHAYGNTVTEDLWTALEQASGKPVKAIANDFTNQTGVPLVRVASSRCEAGSTVMTLTQGRFGVDAVSMAPTNWRVPITPLVVGGGRTSAVVNGAAGATVRLPGCGPAVVNGGQTGYFRTLYAEPELRAFAAGFPRLAAADQLGVLSDTFELGRAGFAPMAGFLDLAEAVPADADPLVLARVIDSLGALAYLQRGRPGEAAFDAYARGRLQPLLARIGWDPRSGEDENLGGLRSHLIFTLSELGDPAVTAEARRRFGAFVARPQDVPAATRSIVLGVAAENADAAVWERLRQLARSSRNPLEKSEYYALLGATRDPALAARALQLSLTPETPVTDTTEIISAVAEDHPAAAFDFIEANKAAIEERLDFNSRSRYVPSVFTGAADAAIVTRLRAYAEANIEASGRRPVEGAIAAIEYRVKVRDERLPEVDRWIARRAARR